MSVGWVGQVIRLMLVLTISSFRELEAINCIRRNLSIFFISVLREEQCFIFHLPRICFSFDTVNYSSQMVDLLKKVTS